MVLAPTGIVRADKVDGSVYSWVDTQVALSVVNSNSPSISSVFLIQDELTGDFEIGFSLQPGRFWVSQLSDREALRTN